MKRSLRAIALLCMVTVPLAGCYTGGNRALQESEKLRVGMEAEEVVAQLGEPDRIGTWRMDLHAPDWPEWDYVYHTPFTMWIVPTVLVFTVILTIPAFYWMMVLGMSSTGSILVRFGECGRVHEIIPFGGTGP